MKKQNLTLGLLTCLVVVSGLGMSGCEYYSDKANPMERRMYNEFNEGDAGDSSKTDISGETVVPNDTQNGTTGTSITTTFDGPVHSPSDAPIINATPPSLTFPTGVTGGSAGAGTVGAGTAGAGTAGAETAGSGSAGAGSTGAGADGGSGSSISLGFRGPAYAPGASPIGSALLPNAASSTGGSGTNGGGALDPSSKTFGIAYTIDTGTGDYRLGYVVGSADARQGWGDRYQAKSLDFTFNGQINALYRKSSDELVFVASRGEKLAWRQCKFADLKTAGTESCKSGDVGTVDADPNALITDRRVHTRWDWGTQGVVTRGTPWVALLADGEIHGFAEPTFDSALQVSHGADHPYNHFRTNLGDLSTTLLDQPVYETVANAVGVKASVDPMSCGLWGSNPNVVRRTVAGREEIHALSVAGFRYDVLGFPEKSKINDQALQHQWYDGAWHCERINEEDGEVFSIRSIKSVFSDKSAGTVVAGTAYPAIGMVAVTTTDDDVLELSYIVLATSADGKLKIQKREVIPAVGFDTTYGASVVQAQGSVAAAVRADNGTDGSIQLFYVNTDGHLSIVEKKGAGAWVAKGSLSSDAEGAVGKILGAAVTPSGDVHVLANTADQSGMLHFYAVLGTNGELSSMKYERLTRATPANYKASDFSGASVPLLTP